MSNHHSISSAVLRRRPLAMCLAAAFAAPLASVITARAGVPHASVGVSRSPTHPAAVLVVTSCADDGSVGTLRNVIASATSGDTVDLSQLTCAAITLANGEIAVTQDDLSINGPGAAVLAISGAGVSRVFDHTGAGTLSINALNLIDGYAGAGGGCIYSAANLSVSASTISGCSTVSATGGRGGGLYAKAGATLTQTTVSNNSAYNGGGVYARTGMTLTQTTVSNNSAYGSGGIVALGNLTLTSSTIADNTATFVGGIFTHGNTFSMTGSTVSGNQATLNFGGMFIYPVPHTASAAATISNSTISGNTSGTAIGGAYVNSPLTMSNSTVAFNSSLNAQCSGLFVLNQYSGYNHGGVSTFNSSILSGNISPGGVACDLQSYTSIYQGEFYPQYTTTIGGSNNVVVATNNPALNPLPPDTITADPLLSPLANNGGPTQTHALQAGSPAIDAGTNTLDFEFDQRGEGFPRVVGAAADIGAFESSQQFSGPTIVKSFLPNTILVNGVSRLTITLGNGGTAPATLTAALVDNLPAPLLIAGTPNASTTCANGTVVAPAGGDAVELEAGAQIPVAAACTVTVSVTAPDTGSATNVIGAGALQTDSGSNPDAATATLTMIGQAPPPTLAENFTPTVIPVDGASVLTITLANANATTATLTADLTDALPAPLVVSDSANISTTCPFGNVVVSAAANVVTLNAGAQILSGICTVSVPVTAATAGDFVNALAAGALQTDLGSNPDAVEAGLAVTPLSTPPALTKAFAPDTLAAGDVSTLTITLTNTNATAATLTAHLTDSLPIPVVVATPADATTTCANATVLAESATSNVTLSSGAQIPAASSCTVTVSVVSNTPGVYTNLIAAGGLETDLGASPEAAIALLTVTPSVGAGTIFANGFDGSTP